MYTCDNARLTELPHYVADPPSPLQFHQSYALVVKAAASVDAHYGLHAIVVFIVVSAMCCVEIYALVIINVRDFLRYHLLPLVLVMFDPLAGVLAGLHRPTHHLAHWLPTALRRHRHTFHPTGRQGEQSERSAAAQLALRAPTAFAAPGAAVQVGERLGRPGRRPHRAGAASTRCALRRFYAGDAAGATADRICARSAARAERGRLLQSRPLYDLDGTVALLRHYHT